MQQSDIRFLQSLYLVRSHGADHIRRRLTAKQQQSELHAPAGCGMMGADWVAGEGRHRGGGGIPVGCRSGAHVPALC